MQTLFNSWHQTVLSEFERTLSLCFFGVGKQFFFNRFTVYSNKKNLPVPIGGTNKLCLMDFEDTK